MLPSSPLPTPLASLHSSWASGSSVSELSTVLLSLSAFSFTAAFPVLIAYTLSRHLPWLLGPVVETGLLPGFAVSSMVIALC